MEKITNCNLSTNEAHATNKNYYSPIEQITRSHIPTNEAAHYLNRKPQTLRIWACFENGLIKPIKINGRLAWPVNEIKKLLGMEV